MPFGETLVEEHAVKPTMPYLFNGKELDRDTGLYYYGARYYDPKTALWLNTDPLAEKYPNVSPYTYTLNNPIKYIDPDGRDIIIYYKSSNGKMKTYDYKYGSNYTGKNKYLIAFHKAANTLINKGAGAKLKALDEHKEQVWVRQDIYDEKEGPLFDWGQMSIVWKPTIGLDTSGIGDGNLTPTAVLDHEIDHALNYVQNPDEFHKRRNTIDKTYKNLEEKRVVTGSEQSTAKKLGLIKNGQVTRNKYSGSLYETAGVNTTIPSKTSVIEEVVITAKKKQNEN